MRKSPTAAFLSTMRASRNLTSSGGVLVVGQSDFVGFAESDRAAVHHPEERQLHRSARNLQAFSDIADDYRCRRRLDPKTYRDCLLGSSDSLPGAAERVQLIGVRPFEDHETTLAG